MLGAGRQAKLALALVLGDVVGHHPDPAHMVGGAGSGVEVHIDVGLGDGDYLVLLAGGLLGGAETNDTL